MNWQGKFKEAFLEDDGSFSMGRTIAFVGAGIGVELVQFGLGLAVFEIVSRAPTATGLALVGVGAGFFVGGGGIKLYSKNQEARIVEAQQPPSTPSGDAHI
jgi:hypothetical protein